MARMCMDHEKQSSIETNIFIPVVTSSDFSNWDCATCCTNFQLQTEVAPKNLILL